MAVTSPRARKRRSEKTPQASSIAALPERFTKWFEGRGWSPRRHQLEAVAAAQAGRSALVIAPTGGGKTLAGFLPSLIEISAEIEAWDGKPADRPHKLHTLYISPLKALAVDVARNLQTPALEMGLGVRAETRTGDTPPNRRQRQRAKPPDILLTTPEQLALLIASDHADAFFEDLRCVIVDEAHAIAPTKRGDLLALGMSVLRRWAPAHRRVGLSATVHDEQALARWIGGGEAESEAADGARREAPMSAIAPAHIIHGDPGAPPRIDVLVSDERVPWKGHSGRHAYKEVYEAIKSARTALVFVNTRSQAEMTFQGLWSVNEDALPIALHHGSLAVEQRRKVEAAMTRGELRGVVCTSTLDLGVDWGDVDLVIQMGAPKGSSRLIQRIGRANHRLDEPSRALLVPSNRFEALECRAAQDAVSQMDLDGEPWRPGALDVLAQHVMGRACGEPFDAVALYNEIRTAAPYAELDWETFERVVDFVATGGYALRSYDRFKRIVRGTDGKWRASTPAMAQRHRMNVGAIVEAAYLDVRQITGRAGTPAAARMGRRIGQIEEWYVEHMTPGDTFIFAGALWRFVTVVETSVLVARATEGEPKVPSWQGGKFPLSTFLAKRVRAMLYDPESWIELPAQVREWLEVQRRRSSIPKADDMLVETFPQNDKHYLVAYPFEGRLAHQTLGFLLTRRLERAGLKPMGFVANDYALSVWGIEDMSGVDLDALFAEDMLGDDLDAWLAESVMMKRTFRTCALISGLIERRNPGTEKTGRQVTFSTDLIYDVLVKHQPDHILLEAAWQDAGSALLLDLRRLGDALKRVRGKICHAALDRVSPLAVPVMLEIGRVSIHGDASEALLAESEAELIEAAMRE